MTDRVVNQIMAIRNTGATNMFDITRVQQLAYERGYDALVLFLEKHRDAYASFILTGEKDTQDKR
jgi:hypothetical protein